MERHTILVVDDEPDVVKSVQDLFRLDYRVLGTTNAREGIQILANNEVHVVMTDQRMPEMTGVEFLKRVRGDHPEAIRLLFTGYADIRAVIDAINQGNVYRYITKPWDPEELQTVIREAIERYDLLVERKRLFALLQAQNRELEHANVELSRANELKLAFIQVASHELRTPLTILLGLAGVALRPGWSAEEQHNWLVRIEQAGRRLQRLMDQLIAMLSSGKFDQSIDRKTVDFSGVLQQAVEDVRPFVVLRTQDLLVDVPADLGSLVIDAPKIRDSINHLLLNAIKFTPDGGKITLGAKRLADGGAQITVSDTGSGIEPGFKSRLFEPFFTGFDVTRHSSGHYEHNKQGIGLGLSIVRAFITMHGGTIEVESKPGSGSTFRVTLPAQAEPTSSEAPKAATAPTTTPSAVDTTGSRGPA